MKLPPYLKKGDLIGIVSTASKIDREVVEPAVDLLKDLGFRIELGQYVFEQFNNFAGTDQQRSSDLQKMLDHPEVKVIICSRGGYGTLRTLKGINWENFTQNPKWIVGFSDVTVLHAQMNNLGIATIHGVMPRYFQNENGQTQSFEYLLKALQGEEIKYKIAPTQYNKTGVVSGELIGGNLSILYSLRGTPIDMNTEGKILFIEDLSEYLYHLDRIMMNFKTGGLFNHLGGLIVGGFTGMKDNEIPYGKGVEEIILNAVADYNFPVIFNFPTGHQPDNFALKLGCNTNIKVNADVVSFEQ